MLGSAALSLSMVALGGCDAFFETGLHAWDMAAGDLIVREAGGVVIDPSGGPLDLMSRRVLAAATPELASELTKMLTQYYPLPRDWWNRIWTFRFCCCCESRIDLISFQLSLCTANTEWTKI